MSEQFKVEEMHVSNCVLDKDSYTPYRCLNIRVKMEYEAQQNLRSPGPTIDDYAEKFGKVMAEAFKSANAWNGSLEENDKFQITCEPMEKTPPPSKFGWFKVL